jgi:hypothetical protein
MTFALLGALAPAVQAISYDQNVSEPSPGVFFGTGNANGGWAVDTNNGIELGLRTHQRYPSPANVFNSGGNGTYSWADALGYGSSPGDRSSWNYDFSINVAGTPFSVADFVYQLWVDSDPSAGHAWTFFDPSLIPDNAVFGADYEQNSENVRFSGVGIPGYVNTIAGSYDFSLRALDKNTGALLANTYMRVKVNGGTTGSDTFNGSVPDGGTTLVLLGGALTGLGALRRKFRA